jgi:NADPH:quinone reductase-like Zn-dependent oxidoreductase
MLRREGAMRAAVRDRFGSPDVVEVRDVEVPVPGGDEVLVRVRASSINVAEWYAVAGRPWVGRVDMGLRRPKTPRLGWDFAGVVEAVGGEVTDFRPGDEVFGGRTGALAEYVCARKALALKPTTVTFEQAAAIPTAGLTALQGLRDQGRVEPGSRILVNGASGGVGTFAVQIAKALGAEVTAVCSTQKVAMVRSLGADHVVDYTRDDFTSHDARYDVVLDVAGNRSWSAYRRVLAPRATLVVVGGPKRNRLLGPLGHVIRMWVAALPSRRRVAFFIAKPNRPDLETLRDLVDAGKVTPVVERRYDLGEVADALGYLGEGHARAKIVITM